MAGLWSLQTAGVLHIIVVWWVWRCWWWGTCICRPTCGYTKHSGYQLKLLGEKYPMYTKRIRFQTNIESKEEEKNQINKIMLCFDKKRKGWHVGPEWRELWPRLRYSICWWGCEGRYRSSGYLPTNRPATDIRIPGLACSSHLAMKTFYTNRLSLRTARWDHLSLQSCPALSSTNIGAAPIPLCRHLLNR